MLKFLRTILIIGVVISLGLWPSVAHGGDDGLLSSSDNYVPHFVLVSQTNRVNWSGGFDTAGNAAMVLTWFANHGYNRLLVDLNNDGDINELDTAELASLFANRIETSGKEKSHDLHLFS